jgi:hypothetical protein
VAITSGQDDDPVEGDDPTAEGYLSYELHDWARESRLMLQQLLEGEDVPYVWEGTDLVSPAVFERQVDALIDQVDATLRPVLDPDAELLLYELAEWTDLQCLRLADALDAADVAYEFDVDGNLLVLATDEEAVEALLDTIEFPDALPEEDDPVTHEDERDAQEVLSELFVAADRLRRNARDHEGVLAVADVGAVIGTMRLPFGFEPTVWRTIVERAGALLAAVEGDETSDDDLRELAAELRELLRPIV